MQYVAYKTQSFLAAGAQSGFSTQLYVPRRAFPARCDVNKIGKHNTIL